MRPPGCSANHLPVPHIDRPTPDGFQVAASPVFAERQGMIGACPAVRRQLLDAGR